MSKIFIKRIEIMVGIIGLIAAFNIFNLKDYLTLSYIKASQHRFEILYSEHRLLVIASYILIYILVLHCPYPGLR